ncbi:MAG: HAMP domain-containing histidine kinase [Cellulosilyticum sp.]|nr:HAMP domain-containing histidine kinase [Cellulosilyticum sp.]
MERQTKIGYIKAWLKKRALVISLTLLIMGNYVMVAWLMHLDLEAIWYSTFLGLFVGIATALWDLKTYIKKYEMLLRVYHNRAYGLEDLPETFDLVEMGYQELIKVYYEAFTRQGQQMARQREEANDYYTLWTHQIKTPIAAIKLILQNRQAQVYDSKEQLLLERELFKIEQYAQMALGYLRVESLSEDLVLKQYKLHDIVASALKKYAVCFIGKKLSIDLADFEDSVITDEKWLQFVIEQILSNSIKYTPSGCITIQMKDAQTLMISDTGIGIQSEDLPRIFQRGFTGYNGRMDKKSTGIGLYLCKKITGKLGHTLEVSSKLGEGTSFYIGFPISEKDTLQE